MATIKETFYSRNPKEMERNMRDLMILCKVICPECGAEMTSHELEPGSGHYYNECHVCGYVCGEEPTPQPDMTGVPIAVNSHGLVYTLEDEASTEPVYAEVEEGA